MKSVTVEDSSRADHVKLLKLLQMFPRRLYSGVVHTAELLSFGWKILLDRGY